jgi:AP-1 complex subunit beta-1
MGCIHVEKIIDYISGPLQKCLHDENPYVRKTAALCVAKLYDLKPELVLENGFLEQLHEMISDSNPMVVANRISALSDIHTSATSQPSTSSSDPAIFTVTTTILNKLLIVLNECSEWGRVAILTALSRYQAHDEKESEHICERVVPQFQHVNGSVILAAVRVGDNDLHAQRSSRRFPQAADQGDGTTLGYTTFFSPRSGVDRIAKH